MYLESLIENRLLQCVNGYDASSWNMSKKGL